MKIKAIMMDLGKTLIDNADFSFSRGLEKVYDLVEDKKVPFSTYQAESIALKKETYDVRDSTNKEIWIVDYLHQLNKKLGLKFTVEDEALEDVFLEATSIDNVYPGVISFLDNMKEKNIPLMIVSNSTFSTRAILKEIKNFNIDKYLDFFVSSADFGKRKPGIEIFNHGFNLLKDKYPYLEKEETVYIGNDYNIDIVGSHNASLIPIWFNHNQEVDYNSYALFDFDTYDNLYKKIKKYL